MNEVNFKRVEINDIPKVEEKCDKILNTFFKKTDKKNMTNLLIKKFLYNIPINKKQSSTNLGVKIGSINEEFRLFLCNSRKAMPAIYDPSPLFNKLSSISSRFRGHAQQDAQEFLRFFLGFLKEF